MRKIPVKLARSLTLCAGFLLATVFLLGAGILFFGCAFTERLIDRTLLSTPEMRFDYLDQDRDLADITGSVIGGGGGVGGGC